MIYLIRLNRMNNDRPYVYIGANYINNDMRLHTFMTRDATKACRFTTMDELLDFQDRVVAFLEDLTFFSNSTILSFNSEEELFRDMLKGVL